MTHDHRCLPCIEAFPSVPFRVVYGDGDHWHCAHTYIKPVTARVQELDDAHSRAEYRTPHGGCGEYNVEAGYHVR